MFSGGIIICKVISTVVEVEEDSRRDLEVERIEYWWIIDSMVGGG